MIEERIAMCLVQEPWREARSGWYGSKNGRVVIWWNRKVLADPCVQVYKGEHAIAIENRNITYVSCYCTPNVSVRRFEEMLNELTEILQRSRAVVIGGDFNAKSVMWSAEYTDRRGEGKHARRGSHSLGIAIKSDKGNRYYKRE